MRCCAPLWSGNSRSSVKRWRSWPGLTNVSWRISEHRRIIAFRNILIHGYADVDDRLVWDVVQAKLPVLRREVEQLLR